MPKRKKKKRFPYATSLLLALVLILVGVIILIYPGFVPRIGREEALRLANEAVERCGVSFERLEETPIVVTKTLRDSLKDICPSLRSMEVNETLEVWMGRKVIRTEPQGCDPLKESCIAVYYLNTIVDKDGRFVCAYISYDKDKFLHIEDICGIQPGVNLLIKPSYQRGEEVDIRVINNLNQSIYIDTWKWDEKLVYKKENGEWVEQKIRIFCPQPCDCSPPPLCVPPMPQCTEIKPWQTFNYTWDQTVFKEDKVNCKFDNTTIQKDCLREEKAEKGTYKIRFCYHMRYEGNLFAFCETTGIERCVEREFEIE